jgi:hypothetical protein
LLFRVSIYPQTKRATFSAMPTLFQQVLHPEYNRLDYDVLCRMRRCSVAKFSKVQWRDNVSSHSHPNPFVQFMLMSCSCRGMAGGESAMPQCKQLHPSTLQPHGKRTPSLIVLVRRRSLLASCQSSSAMGAYCTHPLPLVPPRARFHLILISPPVFMLRHGSCTTLTTTHVPRLVVRFLTLIIREGVFTAGGGLVV